jgi:hypothetical protein
VAGRTIKPVAILKTGVDMILQDFDQKLRNHDWYYNYSDDGRVWRAGEQVENEIRSISKLSPQHLELFEAWNQYYFSGPSFEKPQFTEEQRDAVRISLGVL